MEVSEQDSLPVSSHTSRTQNDLPQLSYLMLTSKEKGDGKNTLALMIAIKMS